MKNNAGFTLIEVLIALAILAIALTAVIKSTSQNIRDTLYIQNKTIAAWVGTEVINEARAGVIKFPSSPASMKKEMDMLGQTWPWEANIENTPNPKIKKISVVVFQQSNNKKLSQFESYIYAPQ
jgi:general secretion pathway protein I